MAIERVLIELQTDDSCGAPHDVQVDTFLEAMDMCCSDLWVNDPVSAEFGVEVKILRRIQVRKNEEISL